MLPHKQYGGDNREDYGNAIVIKNITPDELIHMKKIAEDFCKEAIRLYNERGY